jgi:hypothetical protein
MPSEPRRRGSQTWAFVVGSVFSRGVVASTLRRGREPVARGAGSGFEGVLLPLPSYPSAHAAGDPWIWEQTDANLAHLVTF